MSEWIECGLPWARYGFEPVPWPDLEERQRATFEQSSEDLYNAITNDEWQRLEPLREKVRLEMPNSTSAERQAALLHHLETTKMKPKDKTALEKALAYWKEADIQANWYDQQPEIVEARKQQALADERNLKLSFTGSALNKVGTLIEIEDADGKLRTLLLGNVNTLGGSCDDCRGISNEAIIKRYKILIDPTTYEVR